MIYGNRMNLADILAISANLVFILFLFLRIINLFIKGHITQLLLIVLFAIFVLFFKIIDDMTIVEVVRGILGDLSISGLLMFGLLIIFHFFNIKIDLFNYTFCLIILGLGLLLYLTSLDILQVDLYRFGYMPKEFLTVIMILSLLFLYVNPIFAVIWLIALLFFYLKLQYSVNLWDYLIDPILWVTCVFQFLFSVMRKK